MKQREYPLATITEKGAASIRKNHPWVYAEEIVDMPELTENGILVDATDRKGHYLGTGLLSLNSKIRLRILSTNANDRFDAGFFERRVRYAWNYRKSVMSPEDLNCCRVIFSDADQFPGVIVDKFNDVLVSQVSCFGLEQRKGLIYDALLKVFREEGISIRGIYERADTHSRTPEGLPLFKGWYEGAGLPNGATVTEIVENGVRYTVDFENGQKTGFFLDQKYNRRAIMNLARGKRVLDCFTHTGSFALNAALGGAARVTAVDISESAVEMAKRNAELNGLTERMDFVAADVFDLLPGLAEQKTPAYDMIILDPPAFTKSRSTVRSAETGYRQINYRAMCALPRGGFLCTASCSHYMENDLFEKMLQAAAAEAGRSLRQIEVRQQSCDHPILWGVPESSYLKFYIFQVI